MPAHRCPLCDKFPERDDNIPICRGCVEELNEVLE